MAQNQVSLIDTKTYNNAMKQIKDQSEITTRLQNFNFKTSKTYIEFKRRDLLRIRTDSLVTLAIFIAQKIKVNVDRQAKRRKIVMYKWFEENLDKILPILDNIECHYMDETPSETINEQDKSGFFAFD